MGEPEPDRSSYAAVPVGGAAGGQTARGLVETSRASTTKGFVPLQATDQLALCCLGTNQGVFMKKDPDQKKPGEKAPGKFHFNPGNMSGKTVKVGKDQSEENQKTRDGQRDKKP
jgi:hypothetical protein